jgi:hypothetical protein
MGGRDRRSSVVALSPHLPLHSVECIVSALPARTDYRQQKRQQTTDSRQQTAYCRQQKDVKKKEL